MQKNRLKKFQNVPSFDTPENTVAGKRHPLDYSRSVVNRIHIHTHTNFRFGEREREREKNREDSASLLGRRSNRQTRLVSLITTDEAREWHTESRGLNNPVIDSKVDAKRINAI